jgi:GTPase
MKFVDYATITVRSGKGGPGAVAFRREKFIPKGGPSGGDGGRGGSVYLEAAANLQTLLDLRYRRHHFARNGEPGQGANKSGADATDIIIRVPVGTAARRTDDETLIGEVLEPGERLLLVAGGRGGKGNSFFKSPTNRTPQYAQPGEPGEEIDVTLELKLLADVGLVGFPNAGKSTIVAALSEARPKIADYPFTTLVPNLGVVRCDDFKSFVLADIPGIIKGAHEGKGLGIQFLKHIERNAVLAFVIAVDAEDPAEQYATLLTELEAYKADLIGKPRLLILSKIDLLGTDADPALEQLISTFPGSLDVFPISAVTRTGLEPLRRRLLQLVEENAQEVDLP